jgi:DnaJ domain
LHWCWHFLGLQPGASGAEIERAYRRMAKRLHPDCGGSDDDMRRLNDAYNAAKSWSLYDPPPPSEQPNHPDHTPKPTPKTPQSKTQLIPPEVVAFGLMLLILALPLAVVIALRGPQVLPPTSTWSWYNSDNRVCTYSTLPYSGLCGRHGPSNIPSMPEQATITPE